jgi:hypothetical protein
MSDINPKALYDSVQSMEVLHNEGSDSVVISDSRSHDDIAEVFHNERHTVTQTVEQALATARLFTASPDLKAALIAAKREMWLMCRHQWNLSDFKNFAVVQQIDRALQKADGVERGA